jgi:DegV family protein with EDD domain
MGGASARRVGSTAVRVVTDSTAVLPADMATAADLLVVPLTVSIAGEQGLEGIDVMPSEVARALGERRVVVTTSRPAPAEFAAVYRDLFAQGATGIISVHISSRLSGTYESAQLAAEEVGGGIWVVDSQTAGSGLGFAALAACAAARDGAEPHQVEQVALATAARTQTLFYVDTLEYLRRGGRISAAGALVGTAFAVKPILHVEDGQVVLREKVRTSGRALARLVELAVEAAGTSDVDVAVQHLAAQERAQALLEQLRVRFGERLRDAFLSEVGAVIGAHTGPGVIGVAVHRRA